MSEENVIDVPLEDFDLFVHQSRQRFDEAELKKLADNIAEHGQLQPGVAWFDEGRRRWLLVCGERRHRALKIAGKRTMAVKVIHGPMTQARLLEINVSENVQRESLNPIERAVAFRRLMQLEDLTGREVAARLKVSDAMVSNGLALLDLPADMQEKVASGELPASVGAALARLTDNDTRRFLADQFGGGVLGREGVTAEVNRQLKGDRPPPPKPARLAGKLEGGVSLCVTSRQPLTPEILNKVIEHLRREAKKLPGGTPSSPAAAQ